MWTIKYHTSIVLITESNNSLEVTSCDLDVLYATAGAAADAAPAQEETSEPAPAVRKRGRPKKATKLPTAAAQEEPEADAGNVNIPEEMDVDGACLAVLFDFPSVVPDHGERKAVFWLAYMRCVQRHKVF